MTTPVRALLGAALAGFVLLGMAWGSTASLPLESGRDAILRISLGARPERIEICHAQSNEDLAKVAPQMRQREICEGKTARYKLDVLRNGTLLYSQVVRGGGLRHDRQLYVSRDVRVPAAAATFVVRLNRIDTVPPASSEKSDDTNAHDGKADSQNKDEEQPGDVMPGRASREVDERRRRREESVPKDLALEVTTSLGAHEVLLVSYDAENRRLTSAQRTAPVRGR